MTTAPHTLHLIGLEGAAAVPALPVIALQGREILGALYRYEVQCEAATLTDSPEYLLGSRVQLTLGAQTASPRLVWGIATDLELKHTRGVPQLNVVIEPRLAGLRGLRLNQTFLDQSSIATVQTVLEEAGLSAQWQDWQATQLADYPRFAQRTCHDQDALGLCLWLLEYEGIGLRFEHTPAGERMVFFDSLGGYARDVAPYMAGLRLAPPGGFASNADVDLDSADASAEPETLNHLDLVQRGQPEAVRLTEYDPQQAQLDLTSVASDPRADPSAATLHLHGEHYTSAQAGQRLAQVRLDERQCRSLVLQGEGPLLQLTAGGVIQVTSEPYAGYWLVTRTTCHSHRDGRLSVTFEASDAEQMWRPARITPRPQVHGVLAAQIMGGTQIAELDEQGRYLVSYPWPSAAQSTRLRLAQSYAGPGYGVHAPLKDGTEVWLTHANGDPDRPVILGATHHGGQPDVVTAQDNSRHVIRTAAGNKLRLEDRQGQEHIKLHTPGQTTQLNLGHAVDHAKAQRGQGVELRTEGHGTLRSGHQMLVTTGQGGPRSTGEAGRTQSSPEIRATLANLKAFIGNRSTAAQQVGVFGHQTIPSAQWASEALQGTAKTAIGQSKPNQVHWAQGGQVSATSTLLAAASKDLGVWSIGAQDWLAGGTLQIAARDATRLHVEQGGRKAFVSAGDHATTVSKGGFRLVVEGNIAIQSQGGDVSLKAGGASLIATGGGHLGIKSSGSAVYQAQVHLARAAAVMVKGGSGAQVPGVLMPPHMQGGYDEQCVFVDAKGAPFEGVAHAIRLAATDKKQIADSDGEGLTQRVYSQQPVAGQANLIYSAFSADQPAS